MVQNDKKFCSSGSISQVPYIIWLSFMVDISKMIIMIMSSGAFFVLKILIFWGHKGIKRQKTVQNDKKFCLSHCISEEPYIIWFSFMVQTCKMIISPGFCFIFSKFWFFRFLKGWKCKKMVQKDKKFCLSCSISQEPYIMWLSFMVQICKMIISSGVFLNFKILIFHVVRVLKGQKMAQNDKHFCLLHLIFQEPYIIWSSWSYTYV